MEKYLGPFKIISQADTHLFMIHLPKSVYAIYLVFYILMLKPVMSNTFYSQSELLPLPVVIDSKTEYEIS